MKICMPGMHAMVMLTKDEVDLQSLLSALPPTQTPTLPLPSLPSALQHLINFCPICETSIGAIQ